MATIDLTKRGPAGIDGTAIASGHGNPRASFGVEGWLYVNLSSTALFRKENGVWVAKFFMKGLKGDAGKRGISLRSGSGAPSDEVGNPGDAYFNVLNGDVYGPKASNSTWPASPVGSLRGPQGLGWYSGAGVPSNGLGEDGELYFRTNGSVYAKAGGVWSLAVSLVGPQGDQGDQGEQGVTGPAFLLPIETWQTDTGYVVGPPASFVNQNGSSYECLIPHVSGDFATDLAAGKWGLVAGKGLDGLGTGSVNPSNTGALAGKLARFVLDDGTEIADAIMASAADFHAGTDAVKPLTAVTVAEAGELFPISSATTINSDGEDSQGFIVDPLNHNATVAAPTNLVAGKVYTWVFVQGSTGGTLAFNSVFVFPTPPTASVGVGNTDIVQAFLRPSDSKLIARFSKGS